MNLLLLLTLINLIISLCKVEVYNLEDFPSSKIALHMPCEESNMFSTKCMCHIKCTDNNCNNAIELCEKYSISKRCKYVLLRGNSRNRYCTLKREPTADELNSFDISMFPNTTSELNVFKQSNNFIYNRNNSYIYISDYLTKSSIKSNNAMSNLFQINNRSYCGKQFTNDSYIDAFHKKISNNGITLVGISYQAPMTLLNSLRSWNKSGLLDIVDEKIMILSDPLPSEIAMSIQFGFNVIQPNEIINSKKSKDNVFTISSAFYHSLLLSRNEYILFLENDFKMDIDLTIDEIKAELIGGIGLLEKDIEIIRLQSRKYQGCGTFKDCNHHGIHLHNADPVERRRNWFAFYCKSQPGTKRFVSDCLDDPYYRCFTSWDSNWSLNAALVKKSTMLYKKYKTEHGRKSIGEIAADNYEKQDSFEATMSWTLKWMNWRVPICISYNGLFIHEEIETNT